MTNLGDLLDQYAAIVSQIHAYFGYEEAWRVIPIEDRREYFWRLSGEGGGSSVGFAVSVEQLNNTAQGDYYEDEIYTQRHLSKWVYRTADYTMICVDTNTDLNVFLAIFDNAKEVQS